MSDNVYNIVTQSLILILQTSISKGVHLGPCHPISSVGPSISNVTFDIEDFNIECSFDIDVLQLQKLRYRISISKVFDFERLIIRYRRSLTIDIERQLQGCRYRGFMPSISNKHPTISDVDIVYDIEGHYDVRYRRSCHNI